MNRKLVVLLVTFLTLAPLVAHNPQRDVIRALQLEEVQREELSQVLRNWRAQIASLRRELRELQAHLRDLSQSPTPDVDSIGQTYLTIQNLRAQIRAAEEECRVQFEILLTEDQKQRYARIRRLARSARRYERVISALKELNLL